MTESRTLATWVYGTVNRKSGEKHEEGHEVISEVMNIFTIMILMMVSETYILTYTSKLTKLYTLHRCLLYISDCNSIEKRRGEGRKGGKEARKEKGKEGRLVT